MCFLEVILGYRKQSFVLKNTFLENNVYNFFFSSTYCGRYWVAYIVWVVPRQIFTLTNHTIIKVIWIDRTKLPPTSNRESRLFQLNVYIIQTKQITTLLLLLLLLKSLQSCLTLCEPRDGTPPGSPVPGIPQARTLEWVAISFSNAWKWKVKVKSLSRVRLLATPWTAAFQGPLSLGFSRQEHWSGLPFPSPMHESEKWKWSRSVVSDS